MSRLQGASPSAPDVAKIRRAVRLRQEGLSFSQIGEAMGLIRSRAHQLVGMALERRVA